MPYLNLDLNYFDHPKTRRLIGILGPMADVLPLRLWAYCAKIHPRDGVLKGYSEDEINGVIGASRDLLTGPEGTLTASQALVKVGFLKVTKNGFSCVDWHQHQGHIEAFSRRGRENAAKRWNRIASRNASSIAKKESSNAPTYHTLPTEPTIPTIPNQVTAKPVRAVFTPPSLEDVRSYFTERKTSIDPEKFFAHYESNGWMIGKVRVKSWKACLTTWEKNDGFNAKGSGASNVRTQPPAGKYAGLEREA